MICSICAEFIHYRLLLDCCAFCGAQMVGSVESEKYDRESTVCVVICFPYEQRRSLSACLAVKTFDKLIARLAHSCQVIVAIGIAELA